MLPTLAPTSPGGGLARRSAEAFRSGLANLTERFEVAVAKRGGERAEASGRLRAIDEEAPPSPQKRGPRDGGWGADPPPGPSGRAGGSEGTLGREDTYVPSAWDLSRPCGFAPPGAGGGPLPGLWPFPGLGGFLKVGNFSGGGEAAEATATPKSEELAARAATAKQAGARGSLTLDDSPGSQKRRAAAEMVLDEDTAYRDPSSLTSKKYGSRLLENVGAGGGNGSAKGSGGGTPSQKRQLPKYSSPRPA